jgi:hypothetical protein
VRKVGRDATEEGPMTEHDELVEPGPEPGFAGGGGPAETIDPAGDDDADASLADTDHDER